MVPQISVNLVGKVHRRGTGHKLDNPTLGCVDKHLVVENVLFDRFDELSGSGNLTLPFQKLPQPGHLFFKTLVARGALFVGPVGSNTVFGDLVQFVGLDLNFQGGAAITNNGGVQRLVHILFGVAYVVVKLARDRMPHLVNHAQ